MPQPVDEEDQAEAEEPEEPEPEETGPPPWEGRFGEILDGLAAQPKAARADAESWVREAPGDVLALVALGRACEATGDGVRAARAYGSLIDLFPDRADLRRFAGELLSGMKAAERPLELVLDTFAVAVEQRPDHPSSHRLLAWALVEAGRLEDAFDALATGLQRDYPANRFEGVEQILREDLGLIAAAWMRAAPRDRLEIVRRLQNAGGEPAKGASLRFVLHWETDANDVDLHVDDGRGNHADYQHMKLESGGRLFADVTTGYGPECLAVEGQAKDRAYPYRLKVHYYSRGPMGYGMGVLQVIDHDGNGRLRIEHRPFVVMNEDAYLELGTVAAP